MNVTFIELYLNKLIHCNFSSKYILYCKFCNIFYFKIHYDQTHKRIKLLLLLWYCITRGVIIQHTHIDAKFVCIIWKSPHYHPPFHTHKSIRAVLHWWCKIERRNKRIFTWCINNECSYTLYTYYKYTYTETYIYKYTYIYNRYIMYISIRCLCIG